MKKIPLMLLYLCPLLSNGQQGDTLKTSVLEEVVITGQFEPQSARKSVYQIRTIPLERIAARGAVRLQDVLNTELNIRFSQDLALGGSNLSMQGLAGQNVKVLLDGVPMIGRQGTSNEININQLNVNAIDRIEIIEGPMSVVYGADALAGVINIITKKTVDGKFEVQAKVHEETVGSEYGWAEGIHNESVGLGYSKNNWRTRADVSRNYFGGWQGSAAGRDKQWHPKTQYLASGLFGYNKNKSDVYYRADYLFEDIFNPGAFVNGEALDQTYYTNRLMQQVQGTHAFSNRLNFNGVLSYTNYARETQTTTVNEVTNQSRLALGPGLQDVTKFNGITLRSTFQYKFNEKLSLQPGIDFNYETGSGGRIKTGTQTIGDYALFLSVEWKVTDWLQVRPGVRSVYNSVYAAPPVIPSVNTKIKLGEKQDLRLSYGRGFRAPSLRELYFDFFDASHSIEGNPNLESELSHSLNASFNWRLIEGNGFTYTSILGGFYNSVKNMIGYGQKPGNNLITTYLNIDRYQTKGFTWNNTLKGNVWELNAGYALTARFNQYSESYSDLDEFQWSPEITTAASYRIPRAGLKFSLYHKFTGVTPFFELVTVDGQQVARLAETDSFHWADFTIQKDFGKSVSLTAGARNLFDVNSINTTSVATGVHTSGGARPIGYGRSYFLSVSYSLTK
ncbi:MAG: TonB-dependent receptor [Cyclobacteriaceae bacterium]|nr:TonB-dependent receptor [Cyclobacteriaceae bacterium]